MLHRFEYCHGNADVYVEYCAAGNLAHFNWNESTGGMCHYFLFWNAQSSGPQVQQNYKQYRVQEILYPRKKGGGADSMNLKALGLA